jgi:predicted alpha/beta-hydrolase family hydrolase
VGEPPRGRPVSIEVDDAHTVAALFHAPRDASACFVVAHGAGAGMEHPFLAAVADGLSARGVATLRFQFPYMEAGSKRPDRPALAQATVRAAVHKALELAPALPLFAGGKSFGGRMASQAQAERPLPEARGLAFLGFPLHPAKKPSGERAEHLSRVEIPMLFLQGTRDALAEAPLLVPLVRRLRKRATLVPLNGADHSFHVPARSGRSDCQVLDEALDAVAAWMDGVVRRRTPARAGRAPRGLRHKSMTGRPDPSRAARAAAARRSELQEPEGVQRQQDRMEREDGPELEGPRVADEADVARHGDDPEPPHGRHGERAQHEAAREETE